MTSSPRQTKPKACRGHFWWPRLLCGSAGANISAARTVGPRGSSALNIRGRNTRTAPDVHVGTVRDSHAPRLPDGRPYSLHGRRNPKAGRSRTQGGAGLTRTHVPMPMTA